MRAHFPHESQDWYYENNNLKENIYIQWKMVPDSFNTNHIKISDEIYGPHESPRIPPHRVFCGGQVVNKSSSSYSVLSRSINQQSSNYFSNVLINTRIVLD